MSLDIEFEDITRIELMSIPIDVRDYLDENMDKYYNNFVIPEIQAVARASNAPDEFVNGFKFVKTGKAKGKIINTWGTQDNPLARYWNYGTKKNYEIRPKVEHPERRETRDRDIVGDKGQRQHPESLRWIDQTGRRVFAKVVIHPGVEKTLAMEKGIETGTRRMKQQLVRDIKNEKEKE